MNYSAADSLWSPRGLPSSTLPLSRSNFQKPIKRSVPSRSIENLTCKPITMGKTKYKSAVWKVGEVNFNWQSSLYFKMLVENTELDLCPYKALISQLFCLLLDRDSNAKCVRCILSLPVSSYPGTHPGTQTINFSEPSGKRGRRSSPRERKQEKIMGFRKRRHCRGPHALEVTNLNAVASNLPRTCFRSKSLPNSVIFITELHLRVFLTLCSS